jgi:hypothetical protein
MANTKTTILRFSYTTNGLQKEKEKEKEKRKRVKRKLAK